MFRTMASKIKGTIKGNEQTIAINCGAIFGFATSIGAPNQLLEYPLSSMTNAIVPTFAYSFGTAVLTEFFFAGPTHLPIAGLLLVATGNIIYKRFNDTGSKNNINK